MTFLGIKLYSPQKSMGLSYKTIQNLAEAMTPEVIEFIQNDGRWVGFMNEIIPDALEQKMGKLDDELHFDLSMEILGRITLTQAK